MFSDRGFSLIEAIAGILIAGFLVIAIGGLGERLIHHRVTTDSNSAAQSLAEWKMEQLIADATPNPTSANCAGSTSGTNICSTTLATWCNSTAVTWGPNGNLCGNSTTTGAQHGCFPVNESGAASTSTGPYCVKWNVIDASVSASSPLVIPATVPTPTGGTAPTKRIIVEVKHLKNPMVNAKVTTQYPPS